MKTSNWIIYLVNGLIAVLFGLLALFVPIETILTLIKYFGVLILIGGLVMFFFSFKSMQAKKPYMLMMLEALLAIIVGAVIAFYPESSLKIFLIIIGVHATIMGLLQIIMAVQVRKKISNYNMFTLNGIIMLVFGLLLFYDPTGTIRALFTIIGLLALIGGLLLVYLAFKVKGIHD